MGEENIAGRVLANCMPNSKAHKVKSQESVIDQLGFGKKSKAGKAGQEFLEKLGTSKKAKKGKKEKKKKGSSKGGDMKSDIEKYIGKKPNFNL